MLCSQDDDNGALIDSGDIRGRSALHVATAEGHEEQVKILCESGARPHHRDNHRLSVLHLAVALDRHAILEVLCLAALSF